MPTPLKNAYFKWRLVCTSCNNTSKNAEGNFANVSGTETDLKTDTFIPPNSSDEYILMIWLEESNTDQSSTMNQTFSAKVKVTGEFVQYRVPQEYQEVEYIESTGTQYIDAGLKGYHGFDIDFQADSAGDNFIAGPNI